MLQMTKWQKSYVHSNIWNLIRISDSLSAAQTIPQYLSGPRVRRVEQRQVQDLHIAFVQAPDHLQVSWIFCVGVLACEFMESFWL